ncbi:MAG: tRNA (cytidine(34)-2'-O)-methyltransferase [Sediminicola sp.]|tara:strand:- start:35913 stop:36377 length:465 start_codon:yes stop_codon:yes gene_type:complete
MGLNIVLITPEIPNNTGNIGRLTLATGSHLHLVRPFGFELDDKRVKRAGLDYWKHVPLTIYESTEDFFAIHQTKRMVFLSSHGTKTHWDINFTDDLFLIFGKESSGLPKEMLEKHQEELFKIPLYDDHIRSLNLSNAVGIVVYEGLRQLGTGRL